MLLRDEVAQRRMQSAVIVEGYLSKRIYAQLQELDQALVDARIPLREDPQWMRQLTNFDWIEAAVASHKRSWKNLETS